MTEMAKTQDIAGLKKKKSSLPLVMDRAKESDGEIDLPIRPFPSIKKCCIPLGLL